MPAKHGYCSMTNSRVLAPCSRVPCQTSCPRSEACTSRPTFTVNNARDFVSGPAQRQPCSPTHQKNTKNDHAVNPNALDRITHQYRKIPPRASTAVTKLPLNSCPPHLNVRYLMVEIGACRGCACARKLTNRRAGGYFGRLPEQFPAFSRGILKCRPLRLAWPLPPCSQPGLMRSFDLNTAANSPGFAAITNT